MNRLLRLISPTLALLALTLPISASATESEEHLGHDYPRQVVRKGAESSSITVEEKYKALLQLIRSRISSDDEHMAETASQLEADQKSWLSYLEAHCGLTAYVYIYPAGSRMFASQYNSCKMGMNKKRSKFLDDVAYEYK